MENRGSSACIASSIESASETGVSHLKFPFGPAGSLVGTVPSGAEFSKFRQQMFFVQFASAPTCHIQRASSGLFRRSADATTIEVIAYGVLPVDMNVTEMHNPKRLPSRSTTLP